MAVESRPTDILSRMPHPRTVLAVALVAGMAELAYVLMNMSAMPVYLKYSMGYGEASVTAIGAAYLLCEGLMKGPFGLIGDRVGRKALIIGGPLISMVTALLTVYIQPSQWYFFVLLRVLDGLGAAALWPAALAMIADVAEPHKRSQAMSLFNVTYLIGIALGPFVGGAANDLTGYFTRSVVKHSPGFVGRAVQQHPIDPKQASFYVVCVLFAFTALLAWRIIPNLRPHHEHPDAENTQHITVRELLQSLRRIPYTLLMAFLVFFGIGNIMLLVKLFALKEFGLSEVAFGALLLVPCMVIALSSVPLGTIGDRIGRPAAVKWGIGTCAFSLLALIFVRSHWGLVVGGSLIGVGFVVAFPSWMAYISSTCEPRQRGAVMGAVGTAQGAGALLGALVGGVLYEHAHIHVPGMPWINSHYSPFIACIILLLAGWILALLTIRDPAPIEQP